MKKINIAIDGYSSCGKSTLAKALAGELQMSYIDSGAMYRAVTLYALRKNLNESNYNEIIHDLPNIDLRCEWSLHGNKIKLNGEDVTEAIRTPAVQNLVSQISTISEVRKFLVKEQKELAAEGGIVMDGRDIGTVVLPNAELKIFMTASIPVRVKRRYDELSSKGIHITLAEVEQNLRMRDHIDSTRDDSPLSKAADALILDNSDLSPSEQLILAVNWAKERMYRSS